MKNAVIALVTVFVALVPLGAGAAQLETGDQYVLGSGKTVNDNLYVAGGTVTIGGIIAGDLAAAGGNVTLTGEVQEDAAAFGGTVSLLGSVNGDVWAGGGTTTVAKDVGGDLVVVGGSVHILPEAAVAGDLVAAVGDVVVDGIVNGDIKMTGGRLTINGIVGGNIDARVSGTLALGPEAVVHGNISYRSPNQASIATGAMVSGTIDYKPWQKPAFQRPMGTALLGAFAAAGVAKFLAMFVLALVLVYGYKRFSAGVITEATDEFFPNVGRGFVFFIIIPFAVILALISIIGSVIGVLAMLAYIFILILAWSFAALVSGNLVLRLFHRDIRAEPTWRTVLIGCIVYGIVGWIPVLGWVAQALLCLAALGVLMHMVQQNVIART